MTQNISTVRRKEKDERKRRKKKKEKRKREFIKIAMAYCKYHIY